MSIGYLPEFRCRPEIIENQTRFRVWAPFKSSVELVLIETDDSQSAHIMQTGDWGYFELTVPHLKDGSLYAYRLDNGPLRPDPCSLWQPDGVHLPSAIYDATSFTWTDENWVPIAQNDLVFYELHVGTFSDEGTFDAIIPRLNALKELGITAIELLPVAQFPGDRNWGYDGVHPFAAQNSYGGPAGLQRLIDAAH
ncbi:MAG TPA: malto-oligosyltrehalose trehalohydrolase, partial [Planctomycetaceae bacterium]|nr:malto-oligosyltrehalose trehalohydrolase [Planctomycetaceae bacterium]